MGDKKYTVTLGFDRPDDATTIIRLASIINDEFESDGEDVMGAVSFLLSCLCDGLVVHTQYGAAKRMHRETGRILKEKLHPLVAGRTVGQSIGDIRRGRKLTLKDVSEGTSLSVSFLSDIERDQSDPSTKTLLMIAEYYKVDLAYILSAVTGKSSG